MIILDKRIAVRVSKEFYDKCKKAAKRQKIRFSTFVRNALEMNIKG